MAKAKASQAAADIAAGQAGAIDGIPQPKYEWSGQTNQWGTRVLPNKHGLRLGDLNVGIYGEIPDQWQDQTRNPRGAIPRKGVPPLGYSIRDKADLWAESSADLYEEAIQRRWIPATDVPWECSLGHQWYATGSHKANRCGQSVRHLACRRQARYASG